MNDRRIQLRPYVAMPRDALNSAAFSDPHLWHLLCWLQAKAAYRAGPLSINVGSGNRVIQLQKGQVIVGRRKSASEIGMKESTFRDRMKRLEELKEIQIHPDTHFSIVTLCDYWSSDNENSKGRHPAAMNGRQAHSSNFANDSPNQIELSPNFDDTPTPGRRHPDDTKKKGKKGNQLNQPPPPTSSPNWLEVEEGLKSCGVANWQGIQQRAAINSEEALESIDRFRSRPGSWGPGALVQKITTGIWPPADPKAQKRFSRATELRERVQAQGIERGASSECIAATVANALVSNGLEEFVREEERQAVATMRKAAKENPRSLQESNA